MGWCTAGGGLRRSLVLHNFRYRPITYLSLSASKPRSKTFASHKETANTKRDTEHYLVFCTGARYGVHADSPGRGSVRSHVSSRERWHRPDPGLASYPFRIVIPPFGKSFMSDDILPSQAIYNF